MTTQAFPYLVITDGTTLVTIMDGAGGLTNYVLERNGWAPAVAGLARSQLGGRGPYDDVVEELPLDAVRGATAAAALANLQTLRGLIDQAERWANGENVSPVLVKYAPQGSTVSSTSAPLQAMILGRAPNDPGSGVRLAPVFNEVGLTFEIRDVRLRFLRRGAWLLAAAVTGTSASIANPGPYPVTGMTTHPNVSPCQVKLANFSSTTTINFSDGRPILLLAQQGSDLQIGEAETTPITHSASVADAGNNARGGNVLRFTPVTTTEDQICNIVMSSMTSSARRFAFFAAVRNNSGTTSFRLRVCAFSLDETSTAVNSGKVYTPLMVIDTTHTRPRYVPLGIVSLKAPLTQIALMATASAASGTLDIDYVIALAVDNPYARAIQLDYAGIGTSYPAFATAYDVIVDPLPLTDLTPAAYLNKQSTSDKEYMGYFGDTYPVASGTTFQAALMCKKEGDKASWVYGAAVALTLTVSRQNAYLIPE